jgi:hypothetical protein
MNDGSIQKTMIIKIINYRRRSTSADLQVGEKENKNVLRHE